MYKATLSLAILAVAKLALAQQPACLIAAINKFENPADQKTICTKNADQVNSYLESLCPTNFLEDAKKAFKAACDGAKYGTGSSNSTSSGSSSSTAYYPVVYTTTYYDSDCTCTKTKAVSTSRPASAIGFATGTAPAAKGTSGSSAGGAAGAGAGAGAGSGSGAAATGSPIAPALGPSSTSSAQFKGAASQNVVSGAGALLAFAAMVMAL